MSSPARAPRIVLVTRRTSLDLLLARHGTLGQARFALQGLGQSLEPHETSHEAAARALHAVDSALEPERRRTRLDREDLERFLFAPDDLIVVVGQDGLVANVARYLAGQLVFGINPEPARWDGVLCRHRAPDLPAFLAFASGGSDTGLRVERRTMAMALREDGQRILAVNEIFVGHRTHQSARYFVRPPGSRGERQSSSGLICSTATGATGWARSISSQRNLQGTWRGSEDESLAWFVREPFPSISTGVSFDFGKLATGQELEIVSEMGDGGVVFADGIETDRLDFLDGHRLRLGAAAAKLNLVVPEKPATRPGSRHEGPKAAVAGDSEPERRSDRQARRGRGRGAGGDLA